MSDPNDPDGLSEFAPELGADATDRVKAPAAEARSVARAARHVPPLASTAGSTSRPQGGDKTDNDWLSIFRTEPSLGVAAHAREDGLASSDALAASSDDELNQFPSDVRVDRHASDDDCPFLDQFTSQVPSAILRPRPEQVPWAVAPWTAAIVAVIISVSWILHALHPPRSVSREDARAIAASDTKRTEVPSSTSLPLSNTVAPTLRVSAPAVERGIPARTLRHFAAVAIGAPLAAPRSIVPRVVIADARPKRRAPDTAPVARRADRAPAVDAIPLAQVVVPNRAGQEFLSETPRLVLRSDAGNAPVIATPVASEAALQESAVKRTLHSYEQAYEGLDVAATAAVWPSVDRRALARAFDTLQSQGLNFESCAINVTGASATARCRGKLQFVRKVGNSMPTTAEQEWVFTMRRLGANWIIANVAASQASGLAAQRTRSQG